MAYGLYQHHAGSDSALQRTDIFRGTPRVTEIVLHFEKLSWKSDFSQGLSSSESGISVFGAV